MNADTYEYAEINSLTCTDPWLIHDSFMCIFYVTWLIHDSFIHVTWLNGHWCPMCRPKKFVPNSMVWTSINDSCPRWPEHVLRGEIYASCYGMNKYEQCMSQMARTCSRTCSRRCHMYGWVVSYVWTSHIARMNESCHTYERATLHLWMNKVTRMNEACHTNELVHISGV